MNQKKLIFFSVFLLIGAFFVGSFFYKQEIANTAKDKAKNTNLIASHSPIYGKKDASVTIVEFFDPACETCAQFSPLLKQYIKENKNVNLVLRYAPLHQNSDIVVHMLEATKLQGKYWESLNALFSNIQRWTNHHVVEPQKVWQILQEAGVDIDKVAKNMQSTEVKANVKKDIDDMNKLGISKTPSFYVNGKPLQRFGYKQLIDLIESQL